jgi:trehalose-6-phosphate synthase
MNLVAKEFVASRVDEDGVLILSEFAGAAKELTDAVIVNPFSSAEIAAAIERAVTMPAAERRRRMQKLRAVVAENNVYRWACDLLTALRESESDTSMLAGTYCADMEEQIDARRAALLG